MAVFGWLLLAAVLLYPFFKQAARDKKMAEKRVKVESRPAPPIPPKIIPAMQEAVLMTKEETRPSVPVLLRTTNLQEAVILSEILRAPYIDIPGA